MNFRKGFALPAILIASVVLLTVLLVSVVSITSVRSALSDQYYNSIAQSAADAGLEYAKSCLDASSGLPTWSDSKPLKPNTDCSGNDLYTCDTYFDDSHCTVVSNGMSVISNFIVSSPKVSPDGAAIDVVVIGKAILLRPDGTVWREYAQSEIVKLVVQSQVSDSFTGNVVFSSLSVSFSTTCVIASDYKVYCWGYNDNGQVGNGTATNPIANPVAVGGLLADKTIIDIAGHDNGVSGHKCVLTSEGKMYCWGDNSYYQFGSTNNTSSNTPVAVVDSNNVLYSNNKKILKMSVGYETTCAIASDYKAYCWGDNTYGQVGNGVTGGSVANPVAVGGLLANKTVIDITSAYNGTGPEHTCALTSEGRIYCWGRNNLYEFGDGTNTDRNTPTEVVDSNNVLYNSKRIFIPNPYSYYNY